jgi:tripartite-type tricarboxylate transporter receptor subunit TctC
VDYSFEAIPAAMSFIKSGQLKTFGVSTATRLSMLPDMPTIAEESSGAALKFEMIAWLGYMAPAGLSPEIANRLSAEIAKVLNAPEVAERFRSLGMETLWSTPGEMASVIRRDTERYGAIAKKANIKLD